MEDPAITAVIALYNGAPFIEEALDSVFAQTAPPARIIVVDDGSTDDGAAIVERIVQKRIVQKHGAQKREAQKRGAQDRAIHLIRKSNGGQSAARNLGIAQAGTPLIALLDQDDVWYPEHLARLAAPFREKQDTSLGWVYSNVDTVDRHGRPITRRFLDTHPRIEHPKRTLAGCLAHNMAVVPSASLLSRAAFETVGGFDERLIGYEDDDLFLRLFRHGFGNVYLPESLTQWRVFSGSTSWSPHMRRSRMVYFRKLAETFGQEGPRGHAHVRNIIAPRFLKEVLADHARALREGDAAARDSTMEHLDALLPWLKAPVRLPLRAMMPLLRLTRFPPLGRAAGKAAPLARAAYRLFSH